MGFVRTCMMAMCERDRVLLSVKCMLAFVLLSMLMLNSVQGMGTSGRMAVSYGANGQALCYIRDDGSQLVTCYGTDQASVYGAPPRLVLSGITGGDGFICGLSQMDQTPYCWGNNIYVPDGVPSLPNPNQKYTSISAGDNHLCALRSNSAVNLSSTEHLLVRKKSNITPSRWVDCWGYNITDSYINQPVTSITAGSFFSCGLYASNRTAVCWGDDSGYGVLAGIPALSFVTIAAGGYHVCGIVEGSTAQTVCWGRSLGPPSDPPLALSLSLLVSGKFHTCGLRADTLAPVCWGLALSSTIPAPGNQSLQAMVAGDYFTCAITGGTKETICWGSNYPFLTPVTAISPISQPPMNNFCNSSSCSNPPAKRGHGVTIQVPIIIGELVTAVVVISALLLAAYFWLRYKVSMGAPSGNSSDSKGAATITPTTTTLTTTDASPRHAHAYKKSSYRKSFHKIRSYVIQRQESRNPRAQRFKYQELEEATGAFSVESEIGRGSFSCVYKGTLSNGTVVAVKRAVASPAQPENVPISKEFRNELDLLSRLNHAHLLNLLGYCEEGGERLLVYEFMCNGTLFENLHCDPPEQLSWMRRLKIAVQAARGLEYLHGYATPPVIHRDIKSCNILLDEEWNARVADFGLSLFGPTDSNCPLSEPPAGTLGYLDPEYYRLHYLTTKSDVYSFGVLLLELLSGRKAIDMAYPQGNIVEWARPLVKSGQAAAILDNRIELPPAIEALEKVAKVASNCVRMRGKDRPNMDKITTSLERALALLIGLNEDDASLILPTEIVLGSARLHKKGSSRRSSSRKTESRLSDSEYGEPVKEREELPEGAPLPPSRQPRCLHHSCDDLSRIPPHTRPQPISKTQSLNRVHSFNRVQAQRSRFQDSLELHSFDSPPLRGFYHSRADLESVKSFARVDDPLPSSSCQPDDFEISPELPQQQ